MKIFCIAACLILPLAAQSGWCGPPEGAIRLRDVVEVNRPTVLLFDLLPSEAPASLKKAGAAVELCPAPQPGSMRVLRAEQILAATKGRFDSALFLVPESVLIRSRGWPIRESAVRDAIVEFMDKHGLDGGLLSLARLEMPEIPAGNQNPRLQVTKIRRDVGMIEARLRCVERESCGSFLIRMALPLSQVWPRDVLQATFLNPRSGQTNPPRLNPRTLVAKGKTATLLLESETLRISLPVTCLEAGALNQRIRVWDKQSRHVLYGEVIAEGLLRASL